MNGQAQTDSGGGRGGFAPLQIIGRDPGPLARLEEVKRDASVMVVIANRVAEGESLKSIARAWGVPHGALLLWLMDDNTRFTAYRNACVAAGFTEADEAKEIADGVPVQAVDPRGAPLFDEAGKPVLVEFDVARDKLRSDVRRWGASKKAPEFFGERLDVVAHRALPSEESLLAQLHAMVSANPGLLDQLNAMRGNAALPAGLTFTQSNSDAPQNPQAARPGPDPSGRTFCGVEESQDTNITAPGGATGDGHG